MTLTRASLVVSLLLLVGLVLGGCAQPLLGPAEPTRSDVKIQGLTPEQLGTLGAKLNQNPRNQSSILADYNITRSQFEQAINTISSDPALARRYRQAYEAQLQSS